METASCFPHLFSGFAWQWYRTIFTLLLLLFCSIRESMGLTTTSTAPCLQNQTFSLLQFKQSLPVPEQLLESFSTWQNGTDCCAWSGVSCDTTTGFVTMLELSSFGLEVRMLDPAPLVKLHHLRHLDFSGSSISGEIPSTLSDISSLIHLDLSDNHFYGSVPKSFNRLSNLKILDLGNNRLSGEIPPDLFNHPTLQTLILHSNMLNGSLPQFGRGITSVLREVDLCYNMLDGKIPSSISNLSQLRHLDLAYNKFCGTFHLSVFENLKNLSYLNLSGNELAVEFDLENHATFFRELHTLGLGSCKMKGGFPLFFQSTKMLEILHLGNNGITGKIPTWLWSLPNLRLLYLSHNKIDGLDEIVNNVSAQTAKSNLQALYLSNNNISGKLPITWVSSLPNLRILFLSFNMIDSLDEIVNMNAQTTKSNMEALYLSNNNIRGKIPITWVQGLPNLQYLDLKTNQLKGQIPRGLVSQQNLRFLDLKENQLNGDVAELFYNCSGNMEYLDLSDNHFFGSLPHNWLTKFDNLQFLDMSNNYLHGPIPEELIISSTKSLNVLVLNGNKLMGKLPRSLSNCSQLEILNLGSNQLSDVFPIWLGQLDQLLVLMLQSNKLYGNIIASKYAFSSLHVLDISGNQFQGHLPPELFQNFESMMLKQIRLEQQDQISTNAGDEDLYLDIKGQIEKLKLMTILTSIDLSRNLFVGEIPEVIGALDGLYSLNLSWNNLDGSIPKSFGQLHEIESLDLSHNNLSGSIPEELKKITFLSKLDLSYNNLQGRIPRGNQFDTFTIASFEGNPGLCGPPLVISCLSNKNDSQCSINHVEEKDQNWEYLTTGIGVVVGLLTIILPLMFIERVANWYWHFMDQVPEALIFLVNNLFCTR